MKTLLLLSLLTLGSCTVLKLDIYDAALACAGDLDEYLYKDKHTNIDVKCKDVTDT